MMPPPEPTQVAMTQPRSGGVFAVCLPGCCGAGSKVGKISKHLVDFCLNMAFNLSNAPRHPLPGRGLEMKMQQITVPTVRTAAGLRAQAAAIRPTASDYAAHQITGTTAELEALALAARHLEVAANLSSPANRRSYLRSRGIEVAA